MSTYQQFDFSKEAVRRDKMILTAALAAVVLTAIFAFTYFAAGASAVQSSTVRLHVLAQSDSKEDQRIKLAVRDAILKQDTALISAGVNTKNAESAYAASVEKLESTANEVLLQNGVSYRAHAVFCHEYYPTREYGSLTFPAGVYTSVKILLGSGSGHNWWCVLFPPLCVPAAEGGVEPDKDALDTYVTENGEKILTSGTKYKAGFKVLEWYEKLHEKLSEK